MSSPSDEHDEQELAPLAILWDATQFARRLFDAKIAGLPFPGSWQIPPSINGRICHDIIHGISVIVKALENPHRLGWTLSEYVPHLKSKQSGRNAAEEETLLIQFPPPNRGRVSPVEIVPGVVTSRSGEVVLWYLPNLLSPSAMADLTGAVGDLATHKRAASLLPQKGPPYRSTCQVYRSGDTSNMRPGLMYLTPAWWGIGHEHEPPVPTPHLQNANSEGPAFDFLRSIREVLIVLGAMFSILHPEQYDAAMTLIDRMIESDRGLKDWEQTQRVLQDWPYPFNVFSIIVNRETELHRDSGGPTFGVDFLVTGGNYNDGILDTPSIGKRWMYNPGTVVALMGKVIPHQVGVVNGERYCMASFWRAGLFELYDVPLPLPARREDLLAGREDRDKWRNDDDVPKRGEVGDGP